MAIMRMHKRQFGLSLLLLCAVTGPSKAQDDGINWLGDYREAIREARQTHKPIFLEFRCEA